MSRRPGEARSGMIEAEVAAYYTDQLRVHGANARGAGWNGRACQQERFRQLVALWRGERDFSVTDLGCAYGGLLGYLRRSRTPFCAYTGADVSQEMIATAKKRWAEEPRARFRVTSRPTPSDYVVASGIFNVRLGFSDRDWRGYIEKTLDAMATAAKRGFAFNILTSHSDTERMRSDLWYADPSAMLDLCLKRYSRSVQLVHDYALFEFTVLIRLGSADPKGKRPR